MLWLVHWPCWYLLNLIAEYLIIYWFCVLDSPYLMLGNWIFWSWSLYSSSFTIFTVTCSHPSLRSWCCDYRSAGQSKFQFNHLESRATGASTPVQKQSVSTTNCVNFAFQCVCVLSRPSSVFFFATQYEYESSHSVPWTCQHVDPGNRMLWSSTLDQHRPNSIWSYFHMYGLWSKTQNIYEHVGHQNVCVCVCLCLTMWHPMIKIRWFIMLPNWP